MKIFFAILALSASALGQGTLQRVQKFCEDGNQVVVTQGLNSTTKVQKSYPQCTVTVYLTGTTTLAAIFSDNLSSATPLSNPFTANVDGSFGFYAAPSSCYDVVTSGAGFPAPFTYSYICMGSGGGGTGTVAGTPPHVAKFTGTTTVGDSSGLDPGNTPTQWPLGLNVIAGAGYLQDTVGSGGVSANQLVQFDNSGNIITAVVSANRPKGIADIGGIAGAAVPRAVWGVHACVFDGISVPNDFVAPSSTVAGDCSDVGSVKPNNVTIIGTVKTANSGAATLANVDLLPWDTVAPGSSGGSGTVSLCGTAHSNAYYSAIGTIVVCDPDVTDDGAGNTTMKSAGFTDTAHAGFWYETAGPTPDPAPPSSTQFQVGTTISAPNTFQLPVAAGAADIGKAWGVSSSTTDTNGNPVDVMSLITAGGGTTTRTCLVTIGDPGSASPVIADDNDAPAQCGNDIGSDMTFTGVACWADAGTPTVTPILTGGSGTSLVTGALTCGTASWAAGTLNGSPVLHTFSGTGATCASTPCTVDANITTAGGTAKYIVLKFTATGTGGGGGGGGVGTVTSVATGTGLTGGPITSTGTVSMANTTVTAGSYTSADITVDAQGRLTAAANGSGGGGSGTVTSVDVAMPAIFTMSGGPVTTSGTITGTLNAPGASYLATSTAANTVAWKQINGGADCSNDGAHAMVFTASTGLFSCVAITTGGTGTATSVGLSVNGGSSSGIFAITGSPVTTSGTLNFNPSGTSGGIPYFSSSTVLSSSALLTANNPVIGGGAGVAPSVGSRSGNTTTFATTSGSLPSGDCAKFDASGNVVDAGSVCLTTSLIPHNWIANCASGGTQLNKVAKWGSTTLNAGCATTATTADGTSLGAIIGVCIAGCGTTGVAEIATGGANVSCQFDASAAVVQGHSVKLSATTDGDCADLSVGPANENPDTHFIFATVDSAGSASTVQSVNINSISIGYGDVTAVAATSGSDMTFLNASPYGSQIAMPSILQQFGVVGGLTTDVGITPLGSGGFRIGDPANNAVYYTKLRTCNATCGLSGHDFQIDPRTHGLAGAAVRFYADQGSSVTFYSQLDDEGNVSGTTNFYPWNGNPKKYTLNGNTTLVNNTAIIGEQRNPGEVFQRYMCQDGTGGRTLTDIATFINPSVMPAAASSCTAQEFVSIDSTHTVALAPATPIAVNLTGQTSSASATTLASPTVAGFYRVCGAVQVTTAGTTGTFSTAITYVDINGNSETDTLVSTVTGGTGNLNNHGGACVEFWAGVGAIQYTTTAGTISGAVFATQFRLETM